MALEIRTLLPLFSILTESFMFISHSSRHPEFFESHFIGVERRRRRGITRVFSYWCIIKVKGSLGFMLLSALSCEGSNRTKPANKGPDFKYTNIFYNESNDGQADSTASAPLTLGDMRQDRQLPGVVRE